MPIETPEDLRDHIELVLWPHTLGVLALVDEFAHP